MRFRLLGRSIHSEDGNVFIAIFGAVAMVGILGASVMTFMKGPLATSVKLTKINTAENQMAIGAQVAVMATASQPNNGDCETAPDGYVEPIEWRVPGALPAPTGGGLVPLSLGISKKDPWGTEYGYCVWNHGPTTSGAGCGANMLAGTNARIYPVVSIISAGPDKTFTTTCRDFATADANADGDLLDGGDFPLVSKAADTDDDVITSFTYDEATGVSGGLWSIKAGDASTAVIGKNIETSGTASLKGGLLLPDKSLITCDATTAGVMAMNGTAIEICNGTTWDAITGGGGGGSGSALWLSPNISSGMDVANGDPSCVSGTCYSPNVTFTLTNNLDPAAASAVLAVTLSNTTNFEKVSDNCHGNSIAAGANCQIVVRAKANGNRSYSAILSITGNNSPLATLDGTASGFGCTIGGDGPGGKYAGCAMGGYDLIVTPSGCTAGTSNPVCAGGADTQTIANCTILGNSTVSTSGLQNTVDQMAYTGGSYSYPAAAHCSALSYGGYDDWYMPSYAEMHTLYTNRTLIGGQLGTTSYNTSHVGTTTAGYISPLGTFNTGGCGTYLFRCVRRDPPAVFPAPTTDTTPFAVTFTPSSSATAGETRTSNTVTVDGVTAPVTLSVSGGSGAQFSKNGGAYTSASTTVTNGDQITLRATSPVAGQEDTVSATIGSAGFSWKVRTVANNTIYAFVTSGTAQGNVTVAGADAMCASAASAAGLGGSWLALIAPAPGDGNGPAARAPWNWTTLKNMNNVTVATSFNDLFDGTITAPINRTATNTLSGATYAWVGASDATGLNASAASLSTNTCYTWTSSGGGSTQSYQALVNSTTTHFGGNGFTLQCSSAYPVYCMQDPAGGIADTDPAAVSLAPGVAFSSGAAALSNTVTVTGILQPVTVTVTPSAGTVDIILNGVPQGAGPVVVQPNSTLRFSLTVPAVLGTKNTATIAIGDDTYNWWVGYADSAKEAKVFVTSTAYQGHLGGLAGADAYCNTSAASSSLGLSADWKAILSDSTTDAANRIPWNWGTIKDVTGTTIVSGGFPDLWDGTLASPINKNQNGIATMVAVWTGTLLSGVRDAAVSGVQTNPYCDNWTYGSAAVTGGVAGNTAMTSSQWINNTMAWCTLSRHLYCMENIDGGGDTTPADLSLPYAVQVATSSRQSSSAVLISGMSSGATQTLSVSATGGTPTFTVNGGAEVTSASVTNGDSIVFKMNAPATANSSNKMTITAGSMTAYWRVWTGWDGGGSGIKRVFVSAARYWAGIDFVSVAGADARCQSLATAAALGGTWKAIISGATLENNAAVNRVGYNWSELRTVTGTTVVYAPNLWKAATIPLLSPIIVNQNGTNSADAFGVFTNTKADGNAYSTATDGSNCLDWITSSNIYNPVTGVQSASNGAWINNGGYNSCGSNGMGKHLYCIEQ
jgi:hypothetical protein